MGHTHRQLFVWQRARRLATEIYRHTESFPPSELYGLRLQLRRAAVSVASNIAEGQGRTTSGEFVQLLGHARGSLLEMDTQLAIAFDLKFLSQSEYDRLERETYEVLGLVNRLMSAVDTRSRKSSASLKP